VTWLASAFASELTGGRLALLDPVCGRGTTLNQALMYGWDAAGIDIDGKDFDAYGAFITTWCKRKRIKHQAESSPVRRDRRVVARRLQVTLAAGKDEYKAGQTQRLDVVNADTVRALEFFRPESFHLLAAAVPVWTRLIKPGGAIGVSLNTFIVRPQAAAEVFADSGLLVADWRPHSFAHRVDQAINRDIVVARKA